MVWKGSYVMIFIQADSDSL